MEILICSEVHLERMSPYYACNTMILVCLKSHLKPMLCSFLSFLKLFFMNFKPILRSPFRWRQFNWLGLCLLYQMTLWGQTGFREPSMPSPNAAAFGKYVDIPVSLHTGVPNISIPLHTVSVGNLSVPISLNYHSSSGRSCQ